MLFRVHCCKNKCLKLYYLLNELKNSKNDYLLQAFIDEKGKKRKKVGKMNEIAVLFYTSSTRIFVIEFFTLQLQFKSSNEYK